MLSKHSENLAYAGSAGAFLSGLKWDDIGVIVGIVCAILTLLMNWYYKHKENRRAELALKHQIELKTGRNLDEDEE